MSKTNPKPTDYVLVTMSSKDLSAVKLAIDIALEASAPKYVGVLAGACHLDDKVIKTLKNLTERLSQYEKAKVE